MDKNEEEFLERARDLEIKFKLILCLIALIFFCVMLYFDPHP